MCSKDGGNDNSRFWDLDRAIGLEGVRVAPSRMLQLAAGVAGLITLSVACGGSSGSPPGSPSPETGLEIANVERAFITRPFGGPLPVVLLYLEFEPEAPPSLSFEGVGSDGNAYGGARPIDAKICGFPDYLGVGPDAGNEGNRRTLAFIVEEGVSLVELHWRSGGAVERVTPVPGETVVCTPEESGFGVALPEEGVRSPKEAAVQ